MIAADELTKIAGLTLGKTHRCLPICLCNLSRSIADKRFQKVAKALADSRRFEIFQITPLRFHLENARAGRARLWELFEAIARGLKILEPKSLMDSAGGIPPHPTSARLALNRSGKDDFKFFWRQVL